MKRIVLMLLIGGAVALLQYVAVPTGGAPKRPVAISPAAPTPEGKAPPQQAPSSTRALNPEAPVAGTKATPKTASLIVKDVSIKHYDREVYFGDIDLAPTLARIERGVRLDNDSDDETYQNRERVLPKKPRGYWRKYVHPTRGVGGAGPQRVIIGKRGEIYYTPDHYVTFRKVREAQSPMR